MAESYDFRALRDQIDLARLIAEQTGQEIVRNKIRCPFHADSTPSLHVWNDGRWRCFGCGKHGDVWDFLGYLWYGNGYDPHVHLREVIDRLNGPGVAATVSLPRRAAPEEQPLRPTLDPAIVDWMAGAFGERELAYWRARGIPARAVYACEVGWTGQRYSFPWRYRGLLTAVKLRRDDDLCPTLEPKYLSVKGSRFTAPHNIDEVLLGQPDRVLVVEDEKSVLVAITHRLTAVACPAKQFKAAWLELLSLTSQVVVVADNDEPGVASAMRIAGMLRRSRVIIPPEGKDFFDYHLALRKKLGSLEAAGEAIRRWLDE